MGCCCSKAAADGPVAAPQSIELTEKGPDVAVKKSLISGTGVAYSSNTIEQDAAYAPGVLNHSTPSTRAEGIGQSLQRSLSSSSRALG